MSRESDAHVSVTCARDQAHGHKPTVHGWKHGDWNANKSDTSAAGCNNETRVSDTGGEEGELKTAGIFSLNIRT
jgi:hypothetical protein